MMASEFSILKDKVDYLIKLNLESLQDLESAKVQWLKNTLIAGVIGYVLVKFLDFYFKK